MNSVLPFDLLLNPAAFAESAYSSGSPRRLSDMKDSFADAQAVEAILRTNDPVIYQFHALRQIDERQKLIFGLTTIFAGMIGSEYYMTKGHFHAREHDGDELYLVIKGRGHLLLQARDGSPQTLEMQPGAVYYTPTTWAHRTVNSGDEDLIFLSIWAEDVGYDYETISQRGGFPQRIVKRAGAAVIAANTQFHL